MAEVSSAKPPVLKIGNIAKNMLSTLKVTEIPLMHKIKVGYDVM